MARFQRPAEEEEIRRTTCNLTLSMHEEIERRAKAQFTTFSAVLRQVVAAGLEVTSEEAHPA